MLSLLIFYIEDFRHTRHKTTRKGNSFFVVIQLKELLFIYDEPMETVNHNCDKMSCALHLKCLLNFRFKLLIVSRTTWILQRISLGLFVGFCLMVLVGLIFMVLPREDDDPSILVDNSGIGRERIKIFPFGFIV
jgi:hypothetical protein